MVECVEFFEITARVDLRRQGIFEANSSAIGRVPSDVAQAYLGTLLAVEQFKAIVDPSGLLKNACITTPVNAMYMI